jgi:hypothetical protein
MAGAGVHCWKILVPDKLQSSIKSHNVHVMLCGAVGGGVCGWWTHHKRKHTAFLKHVRKFEIKKF